MDPQKKQIKDIVKRTVGWQENDSNFRMGATISLGKAHTFYTKLIEEERKVTAQKERYIQTLEKELGTLGAIAAKWAPVKEVD